MKSKLKYGGIGHSFKLCNIDIPDYQNNIDSQRIADKNVNYH